MSAEDVFGKKEEQVMVSVLCATYNHEKYIERALQGFVSQSTNFKFEVIVHEDASTDGTRKVVEEYEKMYPEIIRPVYQKENQYSKGRGLTFRNMLLKARGKYIAVCEGDDFWIDVNKLQRQFEVMEANPECSICVHNIKQVQTDGIEIDSDAKVSQKFEEGILKKEKLAEILWKEGRCPFHTSSFFIKRTVLQPRIDYKEPFVKHMNGDMIMVRLCLAQGEFYYLNHVMTCRRRGVEGSWNLRWGQKSVEEKIAYYQEFAYGEKMFDIYSHKEFYDYIRFYIFMLMAECCIYDTTHIQEYLKEYPIKRKDVKNKQTLWVYIRYLILRCSPKLYKGMYRLKQKLENR